MVTPRNFSTIFGGDDDDDEGIGVDPVVVVDCCGGLVGGIVDVSTHDAILGSVIDATSDTSTGRTSWSGMRILLLLLLLVLSDDNDVSEVGSDEEKGWVVTRRFGKSVTI